MSCHLSTPLSNFDHSVQRIKHWVSDRPGTATAHCPNHLLSPLRQLVLVPQTLRRILLAGHNLRQVKERRIKSYLKRCRLHPRHSQLNLEGYLLLPVQRIPRYRLLVRSIHSLPMFYVFTFLRSWKSWRGAHRPQKAI
jgi:hypothetical protein